MKQLQWDKQTKLLWLEEGKNLAKEVRLENLNLGSKDRLVPVRIGDEIKLKRLRELMR